MEYQLLRSGLAGAFMLLASQWAQAQTPVSVRGQMQSASGAIEFATVTLHPAADSTVVKTEFSDAKGQFEFDPSAAGR